jgi:hypothetical protein
MKAYMVVEAELHSFVTVALNEEKCSVILPGRLTPEKKP